LSGFPVRRKAGAGVEEKVAVEVRRWVQHGAAEGEIRGRTEERRVADGSIAREGRGIRRIEFEMSGG
jgi:hypothetical protein